MERTSSRSSQTVVPFGRFALMKTTNEREWPFLVGTLKATMGNIF